jgi:UrcA family protein
LPPGFRRKAQRCLIRTSKQTRINTQLEIPVMSRFTPPVRLRTRTFTALAALGTLSTAAWFASPTIASAAQPSDGIPQTAVYYNPLDLATDQGTQALYRRIVSAARAVCPGYDSRDLTAFADSRECQRQAVARAIVKIGDGRLAAVHARAHTWRG